MLGLNAIENCVILNDFQYKINFTSLHVLVVSITNGLCQVYFDRFEGFMIGKGVVK